MAANSSGKHYLQVAAVNYDAFIYDTAQLSVVRGGSELARELPAMLPDLCKKQHFNWKIQKIIASGGSVGLYEVVSDVGDIDLGAVEQNVIGLLRAQDSDYQYLSFVVVTTTLVKGEKFSFALKKLATKAAWQQTNGHTVRPEVPSNSDSCDAKGASGVCIYSGVRAGRKREKALDALSDFTYQRLQKGRALAGGGELFTQLGKVDKQVFDKTPLARSFEDFVDSKDEGIGSKIAYIFFDGNHFGTLREEAEKTDKSYEKFDKRLQGYRGDILKELITPAGEGGLLLRDVLTVRSKLCITPLIWGGDDSLLVVPARAALRTLDTLLSATSTWKTPGSAKSPGTSMTHAFGVLITHHRTPVREARAMAEALASLGKERSRSKNTWTCAVLKSLDFVPFSDSPGGTSMKGYFRKRFGNNKVFSEQFAGLSESLLADTLAQHVQTLLTLPHGPVRRLAKTLCGDSLNNTSVFAQAKDIEMRLLNSLALKERNAVENALNAVLVHCMPHLVAASNSKENDTSNSASQQIRENYYAWVLLEELRDLLPMAATEELVSA